MIPLFFKVLKLQAFLFSPQFTANGFAGSAMHKQICDFYCKFTKYFKMHLSTNYKYAWLDPLCWTEIPKNILEVFILSLRAARLWGTFISIQYSSIQYSPVILGVISVVIIVLEEFFEAFALFYLKTKQKKNKSVSAENFYVMNEGMKLFCSRGGWKMVCTKKRYLFWFWYGFFIAQTMSETCAPGGGQVGAWITAAHQQHSVCTKKSWAESGLEVFRL